MRGRRGQSITPAHFVFETHRPEDEDERSTLFARFRAFAQEQTWSSDIAKEIELILEEWVTDVISYGIIHVPEPFLRVEVSSRARSAQIVVTDNGIPFDPTRRPAPDLSLPLDKRPIGGLGIFMMRKLSSAMNYERKEGQNVLTIKKDLRVPCLGQR